MKESIFKSLTEIYIKKLSSCFSEENIEKMEKLAFDLRKVWSESRNVFICGNGGSAANAIHMANDFHYGIGACGEGPSQSGLKVEALPSNSAIVTCLANDIGYENIYSNQLEAKASKSDLLIVLSGSGNSPNVVNALKKANDIGMKSYAILAFSGGLCKQHADVAIHFKIDDMQIAEDTQLIVGHTCMQWLSSNKPLKNYR